MSEKVFMCVWGAGYHKCDKVAKVEHHNLDFFSGGNGYHEEHLEEIEALDVGGSASFLESGNHTIVRMQ